jgi:hypothetical protein
MWNIVLLLVFLVLFTIVYLLIPRPNTVVVMSVCGNVDDVAKVQDICEKKGFDLVVYDKCNECNDMDKCTILPNVGREQGTWLRYVIDNYPHFHQNILFLPSPIDKYNRLERGLSMLEKGHSGDTIGQWEKFTLDSWNGTPQVPAETRPFKAWYEKHVGEWNPSTPAVYYNGVMATTRDRILSKSKEFFENLHRQVSVSTNAEVGHYLERSMGSVF